MASVVCYLDMYILYCVLKIFGSVQFTVHFGKVLYYTFVYKE